MHGLTRTLCTCVILAALWMPPALAIVHNRFKPDISTALGVPYAFLAGLLLALVLTIVLALLGRRWPAVRPSYLVIAGAGIASIALLLMAERGLLSISA